MSLQLEELRLSMIDAQRHLVASEPIIAAAQFAGALGYGPATTYRFVTALVMTDHLEDRDLWLAVLHKVEDLQIREQIAELEAGRPVVGEVREP